MSITDSLRAAGQVERWHFFPTIQRQTVAEHTWQVLRVWYELYGPPSPEVTVVILLHDAGEIKTGDIPFELGRDHPSVKGQLSSLEKKHVEKMITFNCIPPGLGIPKLSSWEIKRIKMCELLEMLEFALDEIELGNKNGFAIIDNVTAALHLMIMDKDPGDDLEGIEVIRQRCEHLLKQMLLYKV